VYGISQGVGFALNRVVVDYYWKDVQGAQPSTVQFYRSIMWSPWDVKPIYGLLTDLLPFFGYHRRPYFVLSGLYTEPLAFMVILFCAVWKLSSVVQNKGGLLQCTTSWKLGPNISDPYCVRVKYSIENALH
jgi:hypothetical protein